MRDHQEDGRDSICGLWTLQTRSHTDLPHWVMHRHQPTHRLGMIGDRSWLQGEGDGPPWRLVTESGVPVACDPDCVKRNLDSQDVRVVKEAAVGAAPWYHKGYCYSHPRYDYHVHPNGCSASSSGGAGTYMIR